MKAPVEVQFAQKLAANEPGMRNKAVKKLKKWFSARQEPFSDLEMMRLWKGLYYCFWMSDKPLVQEELAENISSFVLCFKSRESSLLFIKSFLLTLGREWAGIDRWRTDKFMMFTRRFLRYIFKFLAASNWDEDLLQETVKVFSENVILCLPPKTNIDFQLHFTDVFLEELAKVAGQNLNTGLLQIILGPFIEVLRNCAETRLTDHVVERIFKHLLRQSDPGIDWQNEELQQDGETENEEEEESEAAEDEDNPAESDEDEEMVAPEDPRAGGVHAVIPQLTVDYQGLSEKMFEVGSEEGLKNKNRQALYELSKMFKDVANDVFPLGPNIEDEEEIPKIKVSKETKKLMQAAEETRKRHHQEKINFKKSLKAKSNPVSVENGEKEEDECNGVNGDVDSDEDEDTNQEKADTTPSQNSEASKELKKKRKREQKRRKKERLMKEASEKEVKENKSKEMIDQDIQRVNLVEIKKKEKKAIVKSIPEEKEMKYQEKQAKVEEVKEKKKKKKKNKDKSEESSVGNQPQVNGADSSHETKKKKKVKESVSDVEVTPVESANAEEKTSKNEAILPPTEATLESFEKMKKKKEKKKAKEKKPLYRIDSDIAFNAPSLSQINLMKLDDEKKPVEMKEQEPSAAVEQTTTPVPAEKVAKKKKLKKYNAESSLLIDESETPILTIKPSALPFVNEQVEAEDSPSKPKKKKKSGGDKSVSEPGASPKSSKVFEEDNCWGELQPGESEIILPNKKYKGDTKLAPAQEAEGPMVTPAKTFTATFLKKALSKSEKKGEKKQVKANSQTLSEPRKKKVNVVLTKNSVQDFGQHLKSVKNSPQTPHDPNKNPPKSALKRTPKGAGTTPVSKTLNPVQLNTQLNGRSSTAKKLAGKNRKRAADFF